MSATATRFQDLATEQALSERLQRQFKADLFLIFISGECSNIDSLRLAILSGASPFPFIDTDDWTPAKSWLSHIRNIEPGGPSLQAQIALITLRWIDDYIDKTRGHAVSDRTRMVRFK